MQQLSEFFVHLFNTEGLSPHAVCLISASELMWLQAVSDAVVGLSYLTIPVALLVFASQRRDLAFSWVFLLFGAFILLCGMTHIMHVVTLWHPLYLAEGLIKFVTALLSLATAALLWPLLPRFLALPSPASMAEVNARLRSEVIERRTAEEIARDLATALERRVQERTAELESASTALRVAHDRSLEILDSISDAFYAVDSDWRLTYANRKCAELWGIDLEDLIGRNFLDVFPWAAGSDSFRGQERVMRDRVPTMIEVVSPVLHRWIEASIYPSRDGGLSIYFRDVTQRREDRRALQQAKEAAERADLAKSQFLAAASHDLRQPFQAMRLFKEVLGAYVTPEGQTALKGLDEAMSAGEELLHALLDVSSLDAGVIKVGAEPVDTKSFALGLCETYQKVCKDKGLKFRCHLDRRNPSFVTDPVLLRRVVRNLLENAIRFTERGGILLAVRERPGRLLIEVWDTGPGIPDDRVEEIFEEFVQIGNPERDRSRGLGLGLAIVRRGIELLGGTVLVRSILGKGTLFRLVLPVAG